MEFRVLAFLIITGNYLFLPGQLVGSKEAMRDMNLIQYSEVIGPLPELIFRTWECGETYFDQDRSTRRREMLTDGEDCTWDFIEVVTLGLRPWNRIWRLHHAQKGSICSNLGGCT